LGFVKKQQLTGNGIRVSKTEKGKGATSGKKKLEERGGGGEKAGKRRRCAERTSEQKLVGRNGKKTTASREKTRCEQRKGKALNRPLLIHGTSWEKENEQ